MGNSKVVGGTDVKQKVLQFMSKNMILMCLIALCAVLSFLSPRFLTWNNWLNIIVQCSTTGIVAVGMTFVVITSGIDLSVGSVLAVSAVIGAAQMKAGVPIALCVVEMLVAGAVIGLIQGLFITRIKMPPFIVTLAGMSICRGMTYVITEARTIPSLPSAFSEYIGSSKIFGIPLLVYLMLVVFAIGHYVLRYTTFGRTVYAIGGNREATRLSGINVKRIECTVYVISGFLAALSGVILTARLGAGVPNVGEALEMDAIASAVIGGTSLSGGFGSMTGTFLGVLIIGVINNAINLLNVNTFWQEVVKGLVILIAVLIDTLKYRKRG